MIIERSGKGTPASVIIGMERAAAKDTTPRMPDQPKTKGTCRP